MENKNGSCPCKRAKCERRGDCGACREHHSKLKLIPACDRIKRKNEKKKSN